MLKGISPLLSPDLLATLARMGHGDEIVLADAHYPAETCNHQVIRADGLKIADLLSAILPLFPLDQYVAAPLAMMAAVEGDRLDPAVETAYRSAIAPHHEGTIVIERLERFAFYTRSQQAFAIVQTGDTAQYGNIILKKGVVR